MTAALDNPGGQRIGAAVVQNLIYRGIFKMEGQVKLGIRNFIVVGAIALIFIFLAKVLTAKYPVPGLTPMVAAV